jgi:hypothetical protein
MAVFAGLFLVMHYRRLSTAISEPAFPTTRQPRQNSPNLDNEYSSCFLPQRSEPTVQPFGSILVIFLETENRSVDDNCSDDCANALANVDHHFSSLIAENCSGDLFCSKHRTEMRLFLASIVLAGKEIIMSETLPKLHSVAAAADHLGISRKSYSSNAMRRVRSSRIPDWSGGSFLQTA